MSSDKEALSKRIAMLERKVARQTKARQIAEQQLEEISLEIFKTNKSLKRSLAESEKRARDLAFLHEISVQIVSDKSQDMMTLSSLKILCEFTDAKFALRLDVKRGKSFLLHQKEVYAAGSGWREKPVLVDAILKKMQNPKLSSDEWVSIDIETADGESFNCIYIAFPTAELSHIIMMLIGDEDFLDDEKRYVLNTAKAQMLTGINRRINEERLKRYTQRLESVLASLKETQAQLIQSEKMASLGLLAAGVAHEINNPLGFVRSNLQVLNDYVNDISELHDILNDAISNDSVDKTFLANAVSSADLAFLCEDSVNIINTNLEGINRVTEIVQTLKNFTHAGDETFEPMSLYEVVDSSLKVVTNQLKYQHEVVNQVKDDIPQILGSFNQLQQVFINFFVNAAQAMPEGGTLKITQSVSSRFIDIFIIDTGIGMDDGTKNKIFTPFFTTKPVGEGTGLGMSVSYAILERHEVEINIESQLKKGTTFRLRFKRIDK